MNKPVIDKGSPLTITFDSLVVIKNIPAVQVKATKLDILSIDDDSINKKVIATTNIPGTSNKIILWEGAAYDAIGQWTNTDVIARIKELYK